MNAIRQRFADWMHERRIAAMSRQVKMLMRAGDYTEARRINKALLVALFARSPQQIARLERARGLR